MNEVEKLAGYQRLIGIVDYNIHIAQVRNNTPVLSQLENAKAKLNTAMKADIFKEILNQLYNKPMKKKATSTTAKSVSSKVKKNVSQSKANVMKKSKVKGQSY